MRCASRRGTSRVSTRLCRNSQGPSPGLTIDVGAARLTPFALKVACILFRSRANAHQDAAFLETLLVMLHALLRNARADQRTDEATRGAACTSTGQRGRQRSCYD